MITLMRSLFKMQENNKNIYRAIDLFAGIGGIRLGIEKAFGENIEFVFASEIDKYARETYYANFGDEPKGDITQIDEKNIPPFDILLAGFPCQAFSIAGKRGGFEDTRGTLFFDVARIIKAKQPKAFLLENVKGLTNHDGGKTFETIINVLKNELNYNVFYKILNAKDFDVPQKRDRIYIVGFKQNIDFTFPKPKEQQRKIKDILEENEVSSKYYLSDVYLNTLIRHKARHQEKGNGFGYQILEHDNIANTLVVGGMGRERNLIYDTRLSDFTPKTNIKGKVNGEYIRKMTPREWARLQGFPDSFKIIVSDVQAYKQFGNSVSVPVIYEIAKEIIKNLDIQRQDNEHERLFFTKTNSQEQRDQSFRLIS